MVTQEQIIHDIKLLPVFGSGKGEMWIAEDFDAPLEELKEYMEERSARNELRYKTHLG